MNAVEEWGRSKGMTKAVGPLGFTDLDREGLLVEGFEELSTMATNYNYPYYQTHPEKLGYRKRVGLGGIHDGGSRQSASSVTTESPTSSRRNMT